MTGPNTRAAAEYIARIQLRGDPRIDRLVILPAAARDEIRVVEVDTHLFPEPGEGIAARVSHATVGGRRYCKHAADVTPQEWEAIEADPSLLPAGWSLEPMQTVRRVP